MKKIITKTLKYVSVFAFVFGFAFNAMAQTWVNDVQVLKVAKTGEFAYTNATTEYVNPGDAVSVQVYYRAGSSVSDAIVRLNGGTGSASTSHTISGGVYSSLGNSTGQVTITSSQPFTLTPVSAVWFKNDGYGNRSQSDISGYAGQIANGSGYSLGNINQNLNTQGVIVVKYQVSNNYNPCQYTNCNPNPYPPCYYTNTCNTNYSDPSVITNSATNVSETSARLNSVASANGSSSVTWYEWGSTVNMTSRTATQTIGLNNNQNVSDVVSGLNAGTLYFYRAVVRNANGVVRYGNVETFKTSGTPVVVNEPPVRTVVRTIVRTVPTTTNLTANNLVPGLVALRVTDTTMVNNNQNACVGDEFNYQIVYQNVSNKTLANAVLEINIPTELEYVRSTNGGTYSNNNRSLVYALGTLAPNQGGTLSVTTKALSSARGKDSVVTSLSLSYTNPDTLAQEEAIAYVLHNFGTCTTNGAALSLFGGAFLPTTLAGWLLLIILILALILIARALYERTRRPQVIVQAPAKPDQF